MINFTMQSRFPSALLNLCLIQFCPELRDYWPVLAISPPRARWAGPAAQSFHAMPGEVAKTRLHDTRMRVVIRQAAFAAALHARSGPCELQQLAVCGDGGLAAKGSFRPGIADEPVPGQAGSEQGSEDQPDQGTQRGILIGCGKAGSSGQGEGWAMTIKTGRADAFRAGPSCDRYGAINASNRASRCRGGTARRRNGFFPPFHMPAFAPS